MAELFGYQAGRRMADMDNAALRKAALDERAAELDIKKAETELSQNEAFLQAIQGGKVEGMVAGEEDIPDALTRLGEIALSTGNIQKGKELLTAGSTIANQQSMAERRQALTNFQNLEVLSNLYGTVGDEVTWDRANAQFELITGQPSPYAGVPYSRALVEQARAATVTQKDQAALDLSAIRQREVEQRISQSEAQERLIEAQERYTEERTKNLEKTGAKPVEGTYVTAVTNELRNQFADIGYLDAGRIRAIALPYAEQVREMVKTDGLDMSEAVLKVLEEANERGELGGWTPMTAFTAGEHRARPLEMPVTKNGIDRTKLKDNKYYQIPGSAQVYLYSAAKKDFIEIQPDMEEEDEFADEDEAMDEEFE